MDQKRIENVSKMIRLLSGNTQYEMSEIARKLEVSQRSAYRYLDTLMMAGHEIHKVRGSIYKMDSLPLAWVGNGNVFQFTDQEVCALKTEVGSMDPVRRFCGGFPGEVEIITNKKITV